MTSAGLTTCVVSRLLASYRIRRISEVALFIAKQCKQKRRQKITQLVFCSFRLSAVVVAVGGALAPYPVPISIPILV